MTVDLRRVVSRGADLIFFLRRCATYHRALWVKRPLVNIQNVLHPPDVLRVQLPRCTTSFPATVSGRASRAGRLSSALSSYCNILWWFRRDSVAAAHRLQRLATEQQIHADFCSGRTERMVSQKRPFGVAAWSSTKRPLTMTSPSEKVIKASLK